MGAYIRMDSKDISINTRYWIDSAEERRYWRTFVNGNFGSHKPWSYLDCPVEEGGK